MLLLGKMKNYVRLQGYQGPKGPQRTFPDNVTPDIDGFTHEPVVLGDVEVKEYTFIDYTK